MSRQRRYHWGSASGLGRILKWKKGLKSGSRPWISGPILKSKAEELAHKLGNPDFMATDGWLSRWKARNQIKFKLSAMKQSTLDSVYMPYALRWQ